MKTKNNDGAGATNIKPGIWSCAIDRNEGWTKTVKAMENGTRSRHAASSVNNPWKKNSMGLGGNVHGYSHGGGSYD